ncbi:hypothetical protein Esti_002951 [Eimeria stiedai]
MPPGRATIVYTPTTVGKLVPHHRLTQQQQQVKARQGGQPEQQQEEVPTQSEYQSNSSTSSASSREWKTGLSGSVGVLGLELPVQTLAAETRASTELRAGAAAASSSSSGRRASLRPPKLPSHRKQQLQQLHQLHRVDHQLRKQQGNKSKAKQEEEEQQQQSSQATSRRFAAANMQASSAPSVRAAGEERLKTAAAGRAPAEAARGGTVAPAPAGAGAAAEEGAPLSPCVISFSREELAFLLTAERKRHRRLLLVTRVLLVSSLLLAVLSLVVTSEPRELQLRKWVQSVLTEEFWKSQGSLASRFAAADQRLQQEQQQQLEAQAIAAAQREAELYNRMQKEMFALQRRIELLEARNSRLVTEAKSLQEEKAKIEDELESRAEQFNRAVRDRIRYKAELELAVDRLLELQSDKGRHGADKESQRASRKKGARAVQYRSPALNDALFGRERGAVPVDSKAPAAAPMGAGASAPAAQLDAGIAAPSASAAGVAAASNSLSDTQKPPGADSAASSTAKGALHEMPGDNATKADGALRTRGRHTRSNNRHK